MTDKHRESQTEPERNLGAMLREQEETLPEDVVQRLAAARREAIAQVPDNRSVWRGWRLPGLAVGLGGAAALVLVVSLSWRGADELPALPLGSEPDIAVVQDLELLESLEFLAWLEEEDAGAG